MEGIEDTKGKEETQMSEAHLTSAAAFVEGGIQDACDDACSICLEAFCESDPSAVTSCKHEFHLQCILEWCQRSSQCPMCWQSISLKDPTSQELLEAVERERNFRLNPPRNSAIFHHPTLGDFELQHLPVGVNDAELEERIIQHLAAAAAMGRHQIARREGRRNRSSNQSRPQFLVFSSHPNAPETGSVSSSPTWREFEPVSVVRIPSPSSSSSNVGEESSEQIAPVSSDVQADPPSSSASASVLVPIQHANSLTNRKTPNESSMNSQDRAGPSEFQDTAGPSEFQSFSESIKSKFNAVSMRYKESISKSTRGWKERFFSRNTTMGDLGSEVRREVNAGIATVSRMMERLDTRGNNGSGGASISSMVEDSSIAESNDQQMSGAGSGSPRTNANASVQASCSPRPGPN